MPLPPTLALARDEALLERAEDVRLDLRRQTLPELGRLRLEVLVVPRALGRADDTRLGLLDAVDDELVHALGLVEVLEPALAHRMDRHAFGQGGAEQRL